MASVGFRRAVRVDGGGGRWWEEMVAHLGLKFGCELKPVFSKPSHKRGYFSHFSWTKGATLKLPADRVTDREDAEWVADAELRTGAKTAAHRGGVAASVAAAVRLNDSITNP
ncbi:hypothetical protein NL676_029589 [Syzygium grande]|nr:hypothetical protein NL676_029589 [Syzygium grande]